MWFCGGDAVVAFPAAAVAEDVDVVVAPSCVVAAAAAAAVAVAAAADSASASEVSGLAEPGWGNSAVERALVAALVVVQEQLHAGVRAVCFDHNYRRSRCSQSELGDS
jgi:hypothetical protein